MTNDPVREVCVRLGRFLEYPVTDFREDVLVCAQEIEPVSERAAECLKRFYSRIKRMELSLWQEYYVRSFDLMPSCPLYLSVHLFGVESFKRAELMAGLSEAFGCQAEPFRELPDHLAVVLTKNRLLSEEDWGELVAMCLVPALGGMIKQLKQEENPYSLILEAIQDLFVGVEKSHV